MNKIKQIFLTLIISFTLGFLAGIVIGLVIGFKTSSAQKEEQTEITHTIVLERIKEQAFLITRTIITDQEVTITIDQGSAWSNFWWGHEITATGVVQVDVGVNLALLDEEDILIDEQAKMIKISLPEAEIYDASLKGEIEVETKSGILKKLLASDDNEDYNLALTRLTSEAQDSVETNTNLLNEACTSALNILQAIFKDTGYIIDDAS